MKTFFLIFALALFSVSAWADELTKSVQQKLKDQGFFYGEATGQPGSETDAAIRRYQIRYGLKVTGALNDETMRSLGLKLDDFPPPQNAWASWQRKPGCDPEQYSETASFSAASTAAENNFFPDSAASCSDSATVAFGGGSSESPA